MTPIVDGIEQQYEKQIVVKRINADVGDGPAIVRDYRIPGHPTTLIFNRSGQEMQRFLGPQSREVIQEVLQETLDSQ
jgi:thioredoxin-like negative regulator of GroEL